jgi:Icc-related predicted phosphoesterase
MPILRILAFSDWRVQNIDDLIELVKHIDEQIDVIIYAGDDTARFLQNGINKFEELAKYSKYGLFGVIGNDCHPHDKVILNGDKVFDLHEQPQIIDNFIFIGQEGASKDISLPIGYTLYKEEEIRTHLNKMIKGNRDKKIVLISHSPPHDILDTAIRFSRDSGGSHIGSPAIRKFIERNKVILTVCGHCHLMGGRFEKIGKKTILNIASHDHNGASGKVAIIYISDERKEAIVNFKPKIKDIYSKYGLLHLYGIGNTYYRKLESAGIITVKNLSELNPAEIAERTGISQKVVDRWPLQARISLNEETILLKKIDINYPVFVDIETNLTGTFILMICVFDAHQNICKQFTAYEESDAEERSLIMNFLSFASKYKNLYCYSGSDFEKRILMKRIDNHRLDKKQLPIIKDLCYEVRKNIVTHLNTYDLKNLGSLFGFKWRHPRIDGIEIPGLYGKFLTSKDKTIIQTIQEKNQDDVLAVWHILSESNKMEIGKPYSLPIAKELS